MEKKTRTLFFITIVVILLTFIFIFLEKGNKVDTRVELVDGKVYNCSGIFVTKNGLTTLYFSNGNSIRIPTNRIEIITEIDK